MTNLHPFIVSATVDDAPQVARLIRQAWSFEQPDVARLAAVLERPEHWVGVARLDDDRVASAVGFISCFLIPEASGARWQIDLLAVQPGYRGQGIGRRLIQAAVIAGQARHAGWAQALIAENNTASEQAFAAAGFTPAAESATLLVRRAQVPSWPSFCDRFRPVSVETLTYSGVWLEDGHGGPPADLPDLISFLCADHPDRSSLLSAASAAGFDKIGRYRSWLFLNAPPTNFPFSKTTKLGRES